MMVLVPGDEHVSSGNEGFVLTRFHYEVLASCLTFQYDS